MYVLGEQGFGVPVPEGQYEPTGHTVPDEKEIIIIVTNGCSGMQPAQLVLVLTV